MTNMELTPAEQIEIKTLSETDRVKKLAEFIIFDDLTVSETLKIKDSSRPSDVNDFIWGMVIDRAISIALANKYRVEF